jgi:hypothetical protein
VSSGDERRSRLPVEAGERARTRTNSRACFSRASMSTCLSFFARSTSDGKMAGFSLNASSP